MTFEIQMLLELMSYQGRPADKDALGGMERSEERPMNEREIAKTV